MKRELLCLAGAGILCCSPSSASASTVFDFRSTSNGGNVGDWFDESFIGSGTVDGLTMYGAAFSVFDQPQPDLFAPVVGFDYYSFYPAIFNFTNGSSDLGIGVFDSFRRSTQLDVGELMSFIFESPVAVKSVTLQVFFKTASDGQGGPVGFQEDQVRIDYGNDFAIFDSPYDFTTGNPTTYTIDFDDLGFNSPILLPGEYLNLIPTFGDGFRLQSIEVVETPVPETTSFLGVSGLILAGLLAHRSKAKTAQS